MNLNVRILRLSERDCRAALLQLGADDPKAVEAVLDRLDDYHARQEGSDGQAR